MEFAPPLNGGGRRRTCVSSLQASLGDQLLFFVPCSICHLPPSALSDRSERKQRQARENDAFAPVAWTYACSLSVCARANTPFHACTTPARHMEVSGEGREIRRDGGHGRGSRRVAATEDEIDGVHAAKAVSAENTDVNEENFVDWIIHSSLPKAVTVLIGIVVFPFMAIYILAIIYLTFRKDTAVTFVDKSASSQIEMENGMPRSDGNRGTEVVPYRVDLAAIPLPD
ncbi:hypothetical protein B296_00000432 [Ensete ventricosum]|uniref:Uncharacterized protein n=1 Tax=Ensete ventricosum TaxID=4639 RepID=A0A427BCH8_ENSVE|nr:hypothetical protein B296_00000432 [Ensete ventricosum]